MHKFLQAWKQVLTNLHVKVVLKLSSHCLFLVDVKNWNKLLPTRDTVNIITIYQFQAFRKKFYKAMTKQSRVANICLKYRTCWKNLGTSLLQVIKTLFYTV